LNKYIIAVFLISILTLFSCGKDDVDVADRSCETLEENVIDALADFSNNATEENCKLYKSILQAQLNNGCVEGSSRDFTERIISSLNCNPF
jgi:hypothetical protein